MNLNDIPIGCLFDSLSVIDPKEIGLVSQINKETSEICQSNTLWKAKYYNRFPVYGFHVKEKNVDSNWIIKFAKRYSILSNIKDHKPKVKSFVKNDIIVTKLLTNAFAYNTEDSINFVIYYYSDNECSYEQCDTINVKNKDFVFLGTEMIVSADKDNISAYSIPLKKFVYSNDNYFGETPHLQPIDSARIAIISKGNCVVYDALRDFNLKCMFTHKKDVISTASLDNSIFIASSNEIIAHDTNNPRGPILWSCYLDDLSVGNMFCTFNTALKRALFQTYIVDLTNGKIIDKFRRSNTNDKIVCGTIANNHIAIFGCDKRSVIFYDYIRKKIISEFQFGIDEGIKSIDANVLNDNIIVAADYTIKILKLPDENGNVKEIRTLQCGSIAQRKRGEIGPIKQVIFNGEKIITNMGKFVRVYDFYTGKLV